MTPDDLRYTTDHEWVRTVEPGKTVRVGITDYAQSALGDIVYVQLPDVGSRVEPGQAVGEVESTKSVSDVYGPLAGVVAARNEALEGSPELINSDPYGQGWMLEIELDDPAAPDGLLDAAAYEQTIQNS